MSGSLDDRVRDAEKLAEKEPLGVDISDYSDEWCAGFLRGQGNALNFLDLDALVRDRERLQRIEEAAREAEKELRRVAASNFTPAPARCERYADKLHAALAVSSGGEETRE